MIMFDIFAFLILLLILIVLFKNFTNFRSQFEREMQELKHDFSRIFKGGRPRTREALLHDLRHDLQELETRYPKKEVAQKRIPEYRQSITEILHEQDGDPLPTDFENIVGQLEEVDQSTIPATDYGQMMRDKLSELERLSPKPLTSEMRSNLIREHYDRAHDLSK